MSNETPATQTINLERFWKSLLDFSYRTENSKDLNEVKAAARRLRESLKAVKIKP